MSSHRDARTPVLASFSLLLASALGPGVSAQDDSYWRIDVDAAHFSGDYGASETVTLDVVTTRVRYRFGRSEIRLSVPYLRVDGGVSIIGGAPTPPPAGPQPGSSSTQTGLGDVSLRFDYDLLQGSKRRPWFTVLARVKAPTGDEDEGLGSGETDVEGGLLLTQPMGRFSLLLEGRFAKLGDPTGVDYDDVTTFSVGLAGRIGKTGSVYGFWENRTHPIQGRQDRESAAVGTSRRFGSQARSRWSIAAYAGLTDTAEDWGLQTTISREF